MFLNNTWKIVYNLVTLQSKTKGKNVDKNQLILQGRIASPFKEGKTQNGDLYIWFLFEVEAKANATSTENNHRQTLNIMCFKSKVIDYVKRLKAHQGSVCVIFGFLSAFPNEVRGKSLITNAVNANEILLIQTRPYND